MNQLAMFPDMRPPRGPTEPIVRTARIDGQYRWALHRAWGGGPCIAWCGTNPSIADDRIDDPTIKREMRFSWLWGFGSMVKINVYPLRSPSMKVLNLWRRSRDTDESAREAWIQNCEEVADIIRGCDLHMAAWGKGVEPEDLKDFLEWADMATIDPEMESKILIDPDFGPTSIPWYCLAKNDDGSPRHTLARGKLRIPDTAKPILWSGAA